MMKYNENIFNNKIINLKKTNLGYKIFKPELNDVEKPKDILPFYPLKDSIIFKNNDIKDKNHTLPIFSQWFNKHYINQIEINNVPDFFNNSTPSKNKDTYKYIRNFIIDLYLIDPKNYLTFTSIRRSISGDIGSLLSIYKFLNGWFIINYVCKNNNFRIKEVLNINSFLPYYKFDKNSNYEIKKMIDSDIKVNSNDLNTLYNYERPSCINCENICGFTWMEKEIEENEVINDNNTIVCMECFNNDKIPLFYAKDEYIRKTISKDKLLKPWSENEKCKIYTFLQKSKENLNYNELFEQFKDRKKEEILLEILKLPKGYLFYEEYDKNNWNVNNIIKKRRNKFKNILNSLDLQNIPKEITKDKNWKDNIINEKEFKMPNNSSLKNLLNENLKFLDNKIKFAYHLEEVVAFDKMILKHSYN